MHMSSLVSPTIFPRLRSYRLLFLCRRPICVACVACASLAAGSSTHAQARGGARHARPWQTEGASRGTLPMLMLPVPSATRAALALTPVHATCNAVAPEQGARAAAGGVKRLSRTLHVSTRKRLHCFATPEARPALPSRSTTTLYRPIPSLWTFDTGFGHHAAAGFECHGGPVK